MNANLALEIAAAAAPWIVDEGMDYASAKRKALAALGLPHKTPLPDNGLVDEAVREHLAIFHADTQPQELLALRRLALVWMHKLQAFNPHVSAAVWQGTATRLSDVHLQLFCDDPKGLLWWLLDQRLKYEEGEAKGFLPEPVPVFSVSVACPELDETVGIHLWAYAAEDAFRAPKNDGKGRPLRGDASSLQRVLAGEVAFFS